MYYGINSSNLLNLQAIHQEKLLPAADLKC